MNTVMDLYRQEVGDRLIWDRDNTGLPVSSGPITGCSRADSFVVLHSIGQNYPQSEPNLRHINLVRLPMTPDFFPSDHQTQGVGLAGSVGSSRADHGIVRMILP
jgi:hypothetical protein